MSTTPQTHVRFAATTAISPQSPYSDAGFSDSANATSTFQYVNSQLIAHGFTRAPGISLEGLSSMDGENVVKCLFAMLGQVVNDMSHSEQFSGKLRTLAYENERLGSMHQQAAQQLAAAERETSSQKAKLKAANKSLQACEAAHKATTHELQRLKSTLQTVRQTHAAELKRREKESERMVDRWTKLSDSQLKIGLASSGISFQSTLANNIIGNKDDDIIGRGDSMLEHALEEAELARKELVEEIGGLKGVILASANELARTVHTAQRKVEAVVVEAPFFTMTDLFPPTPLGLANENFKSLLETLRETLKHLSRGVETDSTSLSRTPLPVPQPEICISSTESDECASMTPVDPVVVCNDKEEGIEVQSSHEDRAKALVRRAANLDAENEPGYGSPSTKCENMTEIMSHKQSRGTDRVKQKRRVRIASADDDFPLIRDDSPLDYESAENPEDTSTSYSQKRGNTFRSPSKKAKASSSSRSPMKASFAVGKTKMRSALKRSSGSSLKSSVSLGHPPSNIIPSFETEVIPKTFAGGSLLGWTSQPLIVSSAFVLPPPSPLASIPPQPDLLSPFKQPLGASSSKIQIPTISPPDHVAPESPTELRPAPAFPRSPHPFPVAKPRAQNMFHAYSPARPSPLSRILMLADSPADGLSLSRSSKAADVTCSVGGAIDEGAATGHEVDVTSILNAVMSLENELGIDEDTAEEISPLREKNARIAFALKNGKAKSASKTVSTKDAKERTKAKGKKSAKSEKENANANAIPVDADGIATTGTGLLKMKGRISPVFGVVGTTTAASATVKKSNANCKGGARRVPIGSVDAAPIGPGWK